MVAEAATERSAEATILAQAVVEDLGDANHPLWAAGSPGLSRNPWDRFDRGTRDRILRRIEAVLDANL
jgi:hypothetical protein